MLDLVELDVGKVEVLKHRSFNCNETGANLFLEKLREINVTNGLGQVSNINNFRSIGS